MQNIWLVLRRHRLVLHCAVVVAMALADINAARSEDSRSDENSGRLEEIVVSAQKRQENLQQVPISAQVIESQELAGRSQNSLQELSQTVPSVHVSGGNGVSNNLYIRGIGSGVHESLDQSVATFVDDIYRARSRMSEGLFLDLDRIEVLKGPQSTFFGNNAIAGALNIVTKKPGDTFDASGRALYGEFGQYVFEGAVGGPITDALGARVAVTRNGAASGWIRNTFTGQDAPVINNRAARLTIGFHPVDRWDATLKIEGSQHEQSGSGFDSPQQYVGCPPPSPVTPDFNGNCSIALAQSVPIGLHQDKISQLPGAGNSLSTFESVLTMHYKVGEQNLTSVSGFYNYHYDLKVDSFVPVPTITVNVPEAYHQFSQEIRLASPAPAVLEYLAGGYFQTDRLSWHGEANLPALNSNISSTPVLSPLVPYLPLALDNPFVQKEDVYSIFASVKWSVTDQLQVHGGLRGSWIHKDVAASNVYGTGTLLYGGLVPLPADVAPLAGAIFGAPPGAAPLVARSDRSWMPSASVQFLPAKDVMFYFRYDKGFLAGGINGQFFGLPLNNPQFSPEHVDAYEVGVKSKWLNDRVLLNLDVFRSDYKDLQVQIPVFNPTVNRYTNVLTNAAKSVSEGVELETEWAASKVLRFGANVTYLKAYYAEFPAASPTVLQSFCSNSTVIYDQNAECSQFPFPVPATRSLTGAATPYAPRWSGTVMASYSIGLPAGFRITTQLLPYFTSRYLTKAPDPLVPETSGYLRLDARITLSSPDERLSLDVIGKNLTDRVIISESDYQLAGREQPRNVAVQVRYRFN